jgi:hypothetical protein
MGRVMNNFIIQWIYSLNLYIPQIIRIVHLPDIGESLTIPPEPRWVSYKDTHVEQNECIKHHEVYRCERVDNRPPNLSILKIFRACIWPEH